MLSKPVCPPVCPPNCESYFDDVVPEQPFDLEDIKQKIVSFTDKSGIRTDIVKALEDPTFKADPQNYIALMKLKRTAYGLEPWETEVLEFLVQNFPLNRSI